MDGPDDDLQHVDRGRRAGRDDRARRHDLRLPRGSARVARRGTAWERALDDWRRLPSDADAVFDREVEVDAGSLAPQVTWGTNPAMVAPVDGVGPGPGGASPTRPTGRAAERALAYMALEPGTPIAEIAVDRVFIGSCTNARIEDLRLVGRRSSAGDGCIRRVRAMVVPGSAAVRRQAEDEGLDAVFERAGFEWRRAGCSMCLGMNPDVLAARRALCVDVEPQLRGTTGTRRAYPSGQPGDGGRGGAHRATWRTSARWRRVKAFRGTTGRVAVLDRADVDTDQIIPKQFLKRIERTGYGEFLFHDWRQDPEFELNRPEYAGRDDPGHGTKLRLRLVARARRLGAPGLRLRGGRRAVLRRHLRGERLADRARHDHAVRAGGPAPDGGHGADRRPRGADDHGPGARAGRVRVRPVPPAELLNGLDDIGLTLEHEDEIAAFESSRPGRVETTSLPA